MPDWACLVGAGTADSRASLAPTGTISRTTSADAASPASPSRMRLIQKPLTAGDTMRVGSHCHAAGPRRSA